MNLIEKHARRKAEARSIVAILKQAKLGLSMAELIGQVGISEQTEEEVQRPRD